MDVADRLELFREGLRRLEAGQEDEVVDLAHPAVLFIDRADLPRDDEPGALRSRGALHMQSLAEGVEPLLRRDELVPQLLPPGGMGEIPRAQKPDPLAAGPQIEMFRHAFPAGRAGIL